MIKKKRILLVLLLLASLAGSQQFLDIFDMGEPQIAAPIHCSTECSNYPTEDHMIYHAGNTLEECLYTISRACGTYATCGMDGEECTSCCSEYCDGAGINGYLSGLPSPLPAEMSKIMSKCRESCTRTCEKNLVVYELRSFFINTVIIIAAIFFVLCGIRFILSNDPSTRNSSKNCMIMVLAGLIIMGLAIASVDLFYQPTEETVKVVPYIDLLEASIDDGVLAFTYRDDWLPTHDVKLYIKHEAPFPLESCKTEDTVDVGDMQIGQQGKYSVGGWCFECQDFIIDFTASEGSWVYSITCSGAKSKCRITKMQVTLSSAFKDDLYIDFTDFKWDPTYVSIDIIVTGVGGCTDDVKWSYQDNCVGDFTPVSCGEGQSVSLTAPGFLDDKKCTSSDFPKTPGTHCVRVEWCDHVEIFRYTPEVDCSAYGTYEECEQDYGVCYWVGDPTTTEGPCLPCSEIDDCEDYPTSYPEDEWKYDGRICPLCNRNPCLFKGGCVITIDYSVINADYQYCIEHGYAYLKNFNLVYSCSNCGEAISCLYPFLDSKGIDECDDYEVPSSCECNPCLWVECWTGDYVDIIVDSRNGVPSASGSTLRLTCAGVTVNGQVMGVASNRITFRITSADLHTLQDAGCKIKILE